MKKQGSIYLKVVFGVLGITLALMLVLQQVVPTAKRTKTEAAVYYEVGDGISTSGFVVRSEQLVSSPSSLFVLSRNEGEWVGTGQTLATTYRDTASQSKQAEIDSISRELDRLQYAYDYCNTNSDGATLEKDIQSQITALSVSLAKHDVPSVGTNADNLKTYILRRYTGADDSAALWDRITALKQQLDTLTVSSGHSASELGAPTGGYFSSSMDGYEEQLKPEMLDGCTLRDFDRISKLTPSVPSGALCKLITSNTWYYLTVAETSAMEGYKVGRHLDVRFSYDIDEALSMEISYLGPDEGGKCILVLKCNTYVSSTTMQRQQSAQIIFKSYAGLRVPKDALYFRNGNPGVYVLEGARAAWKSVELIRDNGDTYLVKLDKSDTDNLWPGDEIIITDEDIEPGKVVWH